MRTDEINSIVSDLDNCKDLKLLKAVIKIQAGLLKNRDTKVEQLKEQISKLESHMGLPDLNLKHG